MENRVQQTVAHCMGQSSLMAPVRIEAPPRVLCSDMVLISLHHHFTQGHSLEALVPSRTIQAFRQVGPRNFPQHSLYWSRPPPKKEELYNCKNSSVSTKMFTWVECVFCFVYALLEWSVSMGQNRHQICSRMDDSEESHATRLKYCPHWLELPTWLFPCFMGEGGQ